MQTAWRCCLTAGCTLWGLLGRCSSRRSSIKSTRRLCTFSPILCMEPRWSYSTASSQETEPGLPTLQQGSHRLAEVRDREGLFQPGNPTLYQDGLVFFLERMSGDKQDLHLGIARFELV